ncbi:hypothetical protein ABH926_010327 [Catenulispora sp. GP43]|uniref:restriction endonuclease n=1 Tax=Catenulispora sp. GP43 TaxID=3156263 RepID=UPI003519535B
MIIGKGDLQPRDFGHRALNKLMGDLISEVDQEWQLAAVYQFLEAWIARRHIRTAEQIGQDADQAMKELTEGLATAHNAFIGDRYESRSGLLLDDLRAVRRQASHLESELEQVRRWQNGQLGYDTRWLYSRDLDDEDRDARERQTSEVAKLGSLMWRVEQLEKRAEDVKETGLRELATLAGVGERRAAFFASELSVSLRAIDTFGGRRFEQFIGTLVEDEGFLIERCGGGKGDKGGDVIGKAPQPDRRRLLAQCKFLSSPDGRIGSQDIQIVNSARHVYDAQIAVVVTNQGYTKDAREFAAEQGIHLLDRDGLRLWATLGDPLMEILALNPLPARPAPLRLPA